MANAFGLALLLAPPVRALHHRLQNIPAARILQMTQSQSQWILAKTVCNFVHERFDGKHICVSTQTAHG